MWGLLLCGGWLLAAGYLVGAMGGCWHQCCPGRTLFSLIHPACSPGLPAAVGCAVGPWGPWSGCSSRHGGEPCPDLKQRRGCLGEHPTCGMAKEVAKILPDSFSRDFRDPWRRAGLLLLEEPSRTFWVAASVAGCQGSWVQEGLQEGCVCPPPALIFV
ncbi:PREDICTED: somatomedin-B and thrombospondin type-1 domain-containing protein-like [Pygoscelis adeliae]|uniref:somatomedin-B and thrombospondin type-1 domain-containing protein-like n=1 Tax=Pygoscelis adeliae TaxID=9238 RepID=UPI0004F4E2CF|nr:PREDICTED: somatomedin-B and thrombospondin type-1 domain-containing protein-like [Pygoscelis adeliae]